MSTAVGKSSCPRPHNQLGNSTLQNTERVQQGQAGQPAGCFLEPRSAERASLPFPSPGALASSTGCSKEQTLLKAVMLG
ncbi:hypothetical protein ACRRTK_016531 [Alexandromys fortis]